MVRALLARGAAVGAAHRIVLQTLAGVEFLLAGGEDEVAPAVAAENGPILHRHRVPLCWPLSRASVVSEPSLTGQS